MPDIVHVTYNQTGKSKKTNAFGTTELKKFGFFADWSPNPKYNL